MKKTAIFILILSFFASCKDEELKVKDDTRRVRTEVLHAEEIPKIVHGTGILSSKSQVKLSFKTGGVIRNIFFDEGQFVKKGQLMAQLNLSEIQAQVSQAHLAVDKATRDYHRAKNLYTDSVATLEQFQNATTAMEYAKSTANIADFNLAFSSIRAPASGKILKRIAEENEVIGAGYPVFLFGSTENDWVIRISVADKDVIKINYNDSANIQFDAYPGKLFNGRVTEIGTSSDPYTGTFEIEITLSETKENLASGFIGKVDIITSIKDKVVKIPVRSLVEADEKTASLFLLNENKAELHKAGIISITRDYILAIPDEKLKEGAIIITEGAGFVRNKAKVEVVK
ncbi:MAG: hypothetical protein A2W91_13980 [Bacteroidetes bacterium GWF2_38_335]|nr:MAG: hypothetical protein A2W91_13980 [Bacteroidetes bacterium GWF2_38_335]OFY77823.1 MAG: hypothetical protein A2281_15670 [Bacteroidetes bacterium RIFOXYA12_FULL_38_20]HBS87369.1 efflux RND transporter periplasmic adaptor subunit [Bacteroidales bacterium]